MSEQSSLQGRTVLIIEDDYLVALVVTAVLEDAGAKVLGPVGSVDEALSFIETEHGVFDAAIVDVNLHGTKSYPIADALVARGKSFVFATGYGEDALDAAYKHFPRCEKPFNAERLVAALAAAEPIN
jgi:DNA-binding NtrC family response regulator